jgi:hypothetical protein
MFADAIPTVIFWRLLRATPSPSDHQDGKRGVGPVFVLAAGGAIQSAKIERRKDCSKTWAPHQRNPEGLHAF